MKDSPNSDFSFEFENTITGRHIKLKNPKTIVNFLQKEKEFWQEIPNKNSIANRYVQYYSQAISRIDSFINESTTLDPESDELKTRWGLATKKLRVPKTETGEKIILSSSPIAEFLKDLYLTNHNQAITAHSYILGLNLSLNTPDQITGAFKAFLATSVNELQIGKNIKNYESTFTKFLNQSELEYNDFKQDFELKQSEIEAWKEQELESFADWIKNIESSVDNLIKDKEHGFHNLEDTYRLQIKLEGPASYWAKRAKKYRNLGWLWSGVMLVLVTAFIFLLKYILYNPPDVFMLNIFNGEAGAIKGVVIFISILTSAAFLMRIVSKLIFSSFHLQRDSEEREQLTIVFLAMIKEGTLKSDETALILQSIFSRADTGLLGKDSGPTMPGSTDNFMKYFQG